MINKIYKKLFRRSSKKNFFFTKDIFKDKRFEIGDFTYGRPKILFENDNASLIIGKYCSISTNVTIFLGGNHRMDWITTYPFNALPDIFPEANDISGHPATKGDVKIGNDVWIGNGVTILSGVTIADGAVIGAGAIVAKNVGPYEVWVGNPARFLKKRFDEDTIDKLQQIKWWGWDDEKVKENIAVLQSNNFKELK